MKKYIKYIAIVLITYTVIGITITLTCPSPNINWIPVSCTISGLEVLAATVLIIGYNNKRLTPFFREPNTVDDVDGHACAMVIIGLAPIGNIAVLPVMVFVFMPLSIIGISRWIMNDPY